MRAIDAEDLKRSIAVSALIEDQKTLEQIIDEQPTIEERKTGKWIDETFEPWGLVYHPYRCDQCGDHSEADSNFCPNCGAKMEENV